MGKVQDCHRLLLCLSFTSYFSFNINSNSFIQFNHIWNQIHPLSLESFFKLLESICVVDYRGNQQVGPRFYGLLNEGPETCKNYITRQWRLIKAVNHLGFHPSNLRSTVSKWCLMRYTGMMEHLESLCASILICTEIGVG